MISKGERKLTGKEIIFAFQVFQGTIPYEKIWISNKLGIENRPFIQTEDTSFITPFVTYKFRYILHMGLVGYIDASSDQKMLYGKKAKYSFIHELTHVWQASRGTWVLTKSMIEQGCAWLQDKKSAYDADDLNLDWNEYGVEQQARIVEEWYSEDNMSEDSPRYKFVRDVIRKK